MKQAFVESITELQHTICHALEDADGAAKFNEDKWHRAGGGGGVSKILTGGNVFEKAGVNISIVDGDVTPPLAAQLKTSGAKFFATGISVVIHPLNPFIPTTHANFRYFELYDNEMNRTDAWFGGGADLTPYYLDEDDASNFHCTFKNACDATDLQFYPAFKRQCDDYFNNPHRGNERRGIGGIFFDYLRPGVQHDQRSLFEFSKKCAAAFLNSYLPIVQKHKHDRYTEQHVHWQHIRRGRYVEFNLLHDRGTLFGLRSNGRTESILMSLPPAVRFDYYDQPLTGTEEEKLIHVLKNPRPWC